jgi:DNA-directed RNA polymerase subunit RPC12/RpoP
MLLKQFDPKNAIFKRGQQDWWPSLVPAINELLERKYQSRLTRAEVRLLHLLKGLNDARNRIMHGLAPEDLELSLPAMSVLGLSRVTYRRKGESVEDILRAVPPIQSDVVKAISYKKFDDYYRFVETFLAEDFPGKYIPECENCGAHAVVNKRCEACFESMDSFTCDSCDEEVLLPESFRFQTQGEIVCPSCGEKISV